MDSRELVKSQIDDGRALIHQLVRDGFGVAAAFWALPVEDGSWNFWVVTPPGQIEPHSYGRLLDSFNRLPDMLLTPNDVSVIGADHPIARDILEAVARNTSRIASRYGTKQLGDMWVEGAYVYPSWCYEPPGSHSMSSNDIVRKVVDLMGQPEAGEASTITLTDGSSFQGLPIGLERINDGMSVKFVVEPLYSPRSYPIAEIAEIH